MKIKLKDIRQATYDANLDTEYREALAHSLMGLGYISDYPLNLYMGIQEEKEELERVETRPLDSNQISEIIHLMMYEMRDDFQYERFKPVALRFLNISEEMRGKRNKESNRIIRKPQFNIYRKRAVMYDLICKVSMTLKKNNLINESREMIERATSSYSYADAFKIINEYVEVIEEEEEEEFE